MAIVSRSKQVPAKPETEGPQAVASADWRGMAGAEHFVQFYETDDYLVNAVSEYVMTSLNAHQPCIVIVTPAHRELLESQLRAAGLDVVGSQARGDLIVRDAAATLAQFMVDDMPEPERFAGVVGGIIAGAAQDRRPVRVFGEMVAQLWLEGNQAAAIHLEECWNSLSHTLPYFSLCCAYPMHGFAGNAFGEPFADICHQHMRVIPDESYSALASSDERTRTITLLQQKARSLEAEIAKRKIIEERLRHSESRYRLLFEASTDGILMVDPDTHTVTDANPIVEHLLGYDREQMLGRELWHIGLFPDRPAVMSVLRELQQQHVVRYSTLPLRTSAGQLRYVEFVGNQFQANGHDVIQCNLRDMTEQRRLERRTREALEALLEMARTLVLTVDTSEGEQEEASAEGTLRRLATLVRNVLDCARVEIVAYDDATNQLQPLAAVGLTAEQERQWRRRVSGAHLTEHLDPEHVVALRAGESFTLDAMPAGRQDAAYGGAIGLISPLRVGNHLVGTLALDFGVAAHTYTEDEEALANAVAQLAALIIERNRLLREREEARTNELALREANRRMNEFLGIASHELKTPVTAIKLNLQLAERHLNTRYPQIESPDDELTWVTQAMESARHVLGRSERGVNRLTRLVDDLVDVSRIQAGKLEMHLEPGDLATIVRDCVEEQRQLNPARAIDLTVPRGDNVAVMADADRIGQVVTNYLTNALKYSAATHPVNVRLEVTGEVARVSVRDEGPGLPPAEHARIWEMFHRAPGLETHSGSGVGLGLGLHISRTIIERHGGQVGVESAPGKGSTFWFTLPVAP